MTALTVVLVLISLCSPVSAADFHKVFVNSILPHEGGFTIDRNDPGNWTGGKVGKGKLKGTKYGIAANTYPKLDIKNLTVAQAEAIYKRDYWDAYHFGDLKSLYIADELCDEVVNGGPGMGRNLLFKTYDALRWAGYTPPVAALNKENMAWINEHIRYRPDRLAFYNTLRINRVAYYVAIVKKKPKMRQYFLSWIDRTIE